MSLTNYLKSVSIIVQNFLTNCNMLMHLSLPMMVKKVFFHWYCSTIQQWVYCWVSMPIPIVSSLKGGVTFPLLPCKLFNEMPMQSENILIFCFILLLLETGRFILAAAGNWCSCWSCMLFLSVLPLKLRWVAFLIVTDMCFSWIQYHSCLDQY